MCLSLVNNLEKFRRIKKQLNENIVLTKIATINEAIFVRNVQNISVEIILKEKDYVSVILVK